MYSNPQDRQWNCALTDFTSLHPKQHLLPDRSCDVYFKMATCLDYSGQGDTGISVNKKINLTNLKSKILFLVITFCRMLLEGCQQPKNAT